MREGDRQAPEGFYKISPAQMNPQSAYYLSFNTGYPNAYDKSLGHTGSQLMVHGDCSSRGCYAMTDEQIAEIYSLGRESFFGGQKSFQFQAYPFRMTPVNMAKHRNNPNMAFWKMIKEGYDHFEVTRQEPRVDFCEKKYVFDAAKPPDATRDLVFDASAKCPAYVIPDEVANAVRQKQEEDQAETAKLIAKGTPVAHLNTGIDGGMNKVFAARVPNGYTGLSDGGDGQNLSLSSLSRAPGTIPSTVNPPHVPGSDDAAPPGRLAAPAPAAAPVAATPASSTRVAAAAADRAVGRVPSAASPARSASASAASDITARHQAPAPAKPRVAEHQTGDPEGDSSEAAKPSRRNRPPLKPSASTPLRRAAAAPKDNVVAGSAPIVPPNSFDSRFSAFK